MGRRPKPEAIKDLEGRPGKRPRKKTIQPAGVAQCPAWLDDVGRKEWARIAPDLRLLGLLSSADQQAFASYCDWYATFLEARASVKADGLTYRTASGQIKKNPAVEIMRQASAEMRKFAVEFGITPGSRTKVTPQTQLQLPGMPDAPKKPEAAATDDAERFFGSASTH